MRGLLCVLLALNLLVLLGILVRQGEAGAGGKGGGVDTPILNGDTNGDGGRDISDAVFLLNWLFLGGQEPVACKCGEPLRETICNDGIDNDGDGAVDEADTDCSPTVDNDEDGFASDSDCDDNNPNVNPGAQEVCNNEIDDDCDTRIDSADGSCEPAETNCGNGIDDDGDGLVDGLDPDCRPVVDEDLDGYPKGPDCDDADPTVNPAAHEICDNTIDDDCDGSPDMSDIDCNQGRE